MKTIRYYEITAEQFKNTEYRPLDVQTFEFETEDGWDIKDVVENEGAGFVAELAVETSDGLKIWNVHDFWDYTEGVPEGAYIVEIG